MFFLMDQFVPSLEQQAFLDIVVDCDNPRFPYYLNNTTENRKGFMHNLMARNTFNHEEDGVISSQFYYPFYEIFKTFCDSHDVIVKKVLRASVNYAIHYKELTCLPHVDHTFDHFNFLLYLTDCKGGETLIYDKNDNIIKYIAPQKNRAVIFSGEVHAVSEFEPGEDRFVLVFTFTKE